jgi:iron(III) transport system substrate-binding protein
VLDVVKDPQGRWIAQRLQLSGIPVRTDKVAPADVPKTWSDLTNAKYKGQMVMPDPSFTAIQLVVVAMLSQKLGWDFYKALRANDTMIVQGHQQVFSTMQSGERVIGAEGSDPRSFAHGHDVPNQTLIYPSEGAFFVSSPTAIIKGAKSPNAAKLFAQFMISPAAQAMIAAGGIHASRPDVPPPPGLPALSGIKALPIDLDYVEEHNRDVKAKFNEIFQ